MSYKISNIIEEFRQQDDCNASTSIESSANSTSHKLDKLMVSIEFFPPKTDTGIASMYSVADQLKTSYPINFVDVTWGAGEFDHIIIIVVRINTI